MQKIKNIFQKKIIILLVIIFFVLFSYIVSIRIQQNVQRKNYQTIFEEAKFGTIEGSLVLPNENASFSDILVCAKDSINEDNNYCTLELIENEKYKNGIGYVLEIPVGEYYVYSIYLKDNSKAFYSRYVSCGFKEECKSHEPIKVKVENGKLIQGIDPIDWK